MKMLLALFAVLMTSSGQEVESVSPAYVGPGGTLMIKLKAPASRAETVVLYVGGVAASNYKVTLEKGHQEAVFDIPAKDAKAPMFQASAQVAVSIGPAGVPAWASEAKVTFGPERLDIVGVHPRKVSPGEKLKLTFKTAAKTTQGLVLFVDGVAVPQLTLGTTEKSNEAWLAIPAEFADTSKLFKSTGTHTISAAPLREEPWTAKESAIEFEPAGVIGISRRSAPQDCSESLSKARANEDCWLRLGDQIGLQVATPAVKALGPADILLWIDGKPLPGLKASQDISQSDSQFTTLVFQLPDQVGALGASPDAGAIAAKDVWMRVLRTPWNDRGVKISAGKIESPLPTRIVDYPVRRLRWGWLLIWTIFFVFVLLWLFRAAARTGLLRDEAVQLEDAQTSKTDLVALRSDAAASGKEATDAETSLANAPPNAANIAALTKARDEAAAKRKAANEALAAAEERYKIESATGATRLGYFLTATILADEKAQTRAFSLARTQMLLWTLIVALSMVWIWLVTNNNDVITTSVLILLGISTSTALSATTVDRNKQAEAATTLEKSPGDVEAATTLKTPRTEGFWTDLISDRNGPAIARVQMVVFTLILMGMFIHEMLTTLVMPELSPTLLGLMGVTSATYVSFKFPEKRV